MWMERQLPRRRGVPIVSSTRQYHHPYNRSRLDARNPVVHVIEHEVQIIVNHASHLIHGSVSTEEILNQS